MATDRQRSVPPVIITSTTATKLFGAVDPVGWRFHSITEGGASDLYEIVGVVTPDPRNPDDDERIRLYMLDTYDLSTSFLIRTENAAEAPTPGAAAPAAIEYEPDEESILAELLPRNVAIQIFRAMLENAASEQGSRMTAMDNATRNAGDMIKRLSIQYNRTRQAAITTELVEIISGAEAL